MTRAPSAYQVQQALSVWASARARLLAENEHDPAAVEELLGAETSDVEEIIAKLLRAARHAEVLAKGAAEMLNDLQERRARFQKRAQDARATAFAVMNALGMDRFELPDVTASVKAGQPRVVVVDEDSVPDIYCHYEKKIDKLTILSVLKAGHKVDGCELSNGLPSIQLRNR